MFHFPSHGNLDLTNVGDFKIGTDRGNDSFLDGKMDGVSIWNKALTDAEIQSSLNSDLLGDEQGLVGLWNFNSGSGDILYDHSGNQNHGTINGATSVSYTHLTLPTTPYV